MVSSGGCGTGNNTGELTICMLNVTYMIVMVATTVDDVSSKEGGQMRGRGVRGGGREVHSRSRNKVCVSPGGPIAV